MNTVLATLKAIPSFGVAFLILALTTAACADPNPGRTALFEAFDTEDPVALDAVLESEDLTAAEAALAQGSALAYRLEVEAAQIAFQSVIDDGDADTILKRAAYLSLAGLAILTGDMAAAARHLNTAAPLPDPDATAQERKDEAQARALANALRTSQPQHRGALTSATLPLSQPDGGLVYADVTVNGQTRPFVLDTGAALSTISRSTAQALDLDIAPDRLTIAAAAVDSLPARAGMAQRLEIGGTRFENVAFLVLDDAALTLPDGQVIQGIVGLPILAQLGRLEFSGLGTRGANRLTFGPSDAPEAAGGDLFIVGTAPVVTVGIQGIEDPVRMMLDSGAKTSFLHDRALEDYPVLKTNTSRQRMTIYGAGGGERRLVTIVPRLPLVIDRTRVTVRDVAVTPFGRSRQHGVLGQDVLSSGDGFVLDFERMDFAVLP